MFIITGLWRVITSGPVSSRELTDSYDDAAAFESTTTDGTTTDSKEVTTTTTRPSRPSTSDQSSTTGESTTIEGSPDVARRFSDFLEVFQQTGKRAILLGIIERDRTGWNSSTGSRPDLSVETSQRLDNSRLTFKASAGDAVATLVLTANRNSKPESTSNTFSGRTWTERNSEENQRENVRGTFYEITLYKQVIGDDASSSVVPTRPATDATYDGYKSYLETRFEDDSCKPESVMLHSDEVYLPDVVPGVRCNANCSACKDGYAYQAVVYPMPTLRARKFDMIQAFYETTRLVPVYCSCLSSDFPRVNDVTCADEVTITQHDRFDSVQTVSMITEDQTHNAQTTVNPYKTSDYASIEPVYEIYDEKNADDIYSGFEPV